MFKSDFTLFIAKRYLFSKKSHNAINIISIISAVGVCVGTMALIVVLSVFNGFEHLAGSLLNSFDSDLKITALRGKTFDAAKTSFNDIKKMSGIRYYSEIVEENALLKYNEKQFIGIIKGTDQQFINNSGIDTMLTEGDAILVKDSIPYAIVGQGIANNLGVNTNDFFSQAYFMAWMEVAKKRTDIILYAYTQSNGYWVNQLGNIPGNFKLNASYGGKQDNLIEQYNLKSVKVVYTVEQAGDMVIDHDDTSAYMQDKSFALLLHGVQPKGSDASKALSVLKKQGIHGYGKKKGVRELAVA